MGGGRTTTQRSALTLSRILHHTRYTVAPRQLELSVDGFPCFFLLFSFIFFVLFSFSLFLAEENASSQVQLFCETVKERANGSGELMVTGEERGAMRE